MQIRLEMLFLNNTVVVEKRSNNAGNFASIFIYSHQHEVENVTINIIFKVDLS